jgi:tRNA(fMet)-specific endonuclease VapC
MFCLDTNVVIGCLNGRAPKVLARLSDEIVAGTGIVLPTLVWFELRYGAAKSDAPVRNRQRLDDFLSNRIELIDYEIGDAEQAAEIRAHLERLGTPIGPYDTLIAAQALRQDATLVTANGREFQRVPGLKIEDWTA